MAAPGATTMRLTVQVLPLAQEDAHGPYRSRALEVFKGRKFAMPVPWDASLEHVWSLIEQRYVDNYLEAQQAANFTMKKLQDAYDCDLDLRDTVASIFGGETDPTKRMIKVVPSFLGRSCSVPFTSHLRPASAQKRARGSNEGEASKRRRTDQLSDPEHHAVLPSTEHSEIGSHGEDGAAAAAVRAATRTTRSHTAASLAFVQHVQTGEAEFAPIVKEESSPELGLSAPAPEADEEMQDEAVDPTVHADDQLPVVLAPEIAEAPEPHSEPESVSHQAVVEPQHNQTRSTSRRKDIWDVPSSSPDFLHKPTPKTTYARSPRTATTVRKEVGLLNSSRLKPIRSQQSQPSPQSLEKRKEPAQPKKRGRPPLNREQHATPSKPAKVKSSASPRAVKKITPRKTASPMVLIKTNGTRAPKNANPAADAGAGAAQEDTELGDARRETSLDSSRPSAQNALHTENDEAYETMEIEPAAAPWHTESWGFGALGKPNGTVGEEEAPVQVDARQESPSQSAREDAGNADGDAAPADEADSLSGFETENSAKPEAAPAQNGYLKSRSISATVSTRSSPAVTRRPARFLTHSPSPEESASEGESEEKSVPPQQPKSPEIAVDEIPSESDSDSTDTSTEDDDGDIEMTDAVTKPEPDVVVPSTAHDALPSSPPKLNGAPTSTPVVPATSQPALSQIIRQTPIPLPPKTPIPLPSISTQTPRSSQSVSAQAAARRPVPRHSGFRTIREQLADAKSPPVITKKNAYDPRSMALSKMANKKLGAAAGLADDDDSEDEESSSSSDSD